MNLTQLVAHLKEEKKLKRDLFNIESGRIQMTTNGSIGLTIRNEKTFPVLDIAHQQIAGRLDIPWKYYQKMKTENPDLLKINVNSWLNRNNKTYFIRLMDEHVRAFLSNRYRVIDHLPLTDCVLNEIQGQKVQCERTHLSETNMFIYFKTPELCATVRVGDEIIGGFVVENSETGHGACKITPRIFRLVCSNGLITETRTRQIHLGKWGGEEENREVFLQIRDSIRNTFDRFGEIVRTIKDSTENTVSNPSRVIENVVSEYKLSDDQRDRILMNFGQEKDNSQYGIANAVARTAQEEKKFEKGFELEKLGGHLITMPMPEFRKFLN